MSQSFTLAFAWDRSNHDDRAHRPSPSPLVFAVNLFTSRTAPATTSTTTPRRAERALRSMPISFRPVRQSRRFTSPSPPANVDPHPSSVSYRAPPRFNLLCVGSPIMCSSASSFYHFILRWPHPSCPSPLSPPTTLPSLKTGWRVRSLPSIVKVSPFLEHMMGLPTQRRLKRGGAR